MSANHIIASLRKLGLALLATTMLLLTPASVSGAQGFTEGPDYVYARTTYDVGTGPITVLVNWNLYGGATNLEYYIHNDVLAAGFGPAVHAAFATWQNDPGSNISFIYRGATAVLSEQILLSNGVWQDSSDGINVVSFNPMPVGFAGRGGLAGLFPIDSTGQPSGPGDGVFDISLTNDPNAFALGAVAGKVDVESTVVHEIGHVLGLLHPSANPNSLMGPVLPDGSTRRTLTAADQFAIRALYPLPGITCYGKTPTIDMTTGAAGEGTAGDDVILGTNGADVIVGRGGNDTICGQGGDDLIIGGDGADLIHGNSGNDTIAGNTGPDILVGGPGNDTLTGGSGNDKMWGITGADNLYGQDGDDLMYGFAGDDKLFGGNGNDFLAGHGGLDLLVGEAGNDQIFGGLAKDNLQGGSGQDVLSGGSGNDTVAGGAGNDRLFGDGGSDVIAGGTGHDELIGGAGNDQMYGGSGNDTCDVSAGFDTTADCISGG